MADGTALSVEQPLINGGGATGDAITRSLEAVPVLVTDLLGGDFTMPGTALAAMAPAAPCRLCRTLPGSRRSVRHEATSPARSCRRSTSRKSVRPASELISAPSKLRRMGLPFKGDKAGAATVDCFMVRGPALETGFSDFDNRKIQKSKGLHYPHHFFMNNSG